MKKKKQKVNYWKYAFFFLVALTMVLLIMDYQERSKVVTLKEIEVPVEYMNYFEDSVGTPFVICSTEQSKCEIVVKRE